MALNALIVKNAKPTGKLYRLGDSDGLYLLVTEKGSKLWRFDFTFNGKRNTISLGKWPAVELGVARDRRDEARRQLALGHDPSLPQEPAAIPTGSLFETVARDWYASSKASWTPRYAALVLGRLEADIFPYLGKDDINTIEAPRLLEVIRKIEARGAIEMAKRVKNHCSEIFQFGIAEGKCGRDPAADIRRALQKPRPKKHRAALPPAQVPEFLTRLKHYDGDELTKLALQFTLVTMVRTQETRFANLREFEGLDTEHPLWRLSPARMKMSREHLVPLPRQAVMIVKRLSEISPANSFLFPADTRHGVISENTMLYALYRMGYHSRQTTHGLRSIASTILNESGLFEPDWIETQLAHADTNKIRGAYNAAIYIPHRRRMLQWWADLVDSRTDASRVAA
jgi:integrase